MAKLNQEQINAISENTDCKIMQPFRILSRPLTLTL